MSGPEYRFRDGVPRPKGGVAPERVAEALQALEDDEGRITPERLLDASKVPDSVFHEDLWGEGDQVWAQRGRRERCRQLIGCVVEVHVIGGASYETRVFEHVSGGFMRLETIAADPDLVDELFGGVEKSLNEAQSKISRLRAYLRERRQSEAS